MISEMEGNLLMFKDEDVRSLQRLLHDARTVVVTAHRNPDGDAVGASLGLARMLRKQGHDVTVILPNAYDHFLAWLPGAEEVMLASKNLRRASKLFREADLIFCLDFSAMRRIGELEQVVREADAPKIMIDHHIDPEDWPALKFHDTAMSSTAELVYRLLLQMGLDRELDRETAQCLYTGLVMDTGSFRFSSTTADVHRIVARLLATGIDVGRIHNLLFDNFSETRARFLGYVLYERLTVLPELHTAYMTLPQADIKRFRIKSGDTDGFVNYGLSLKGIHFAVMMKETREGTKLSFRSIGQFACNEFAAHFGGGGHHNASGGRTELPLAETEKKFLDLLQDYKDQLEY